MMVIMAVVSFKDVLENKHKSLIKYVVTDISIIIWQVTKSMICTWMVTAEWYDQKSEKMPKSRSLFKGVICIRENINLYIYDSIHLLNV